MCPVCNLGDHDHRWDRCPMCNLGDRDDDNEMRGAWKIDEQAFIQQ